jgi:hypothetical protein
VTPGFASVPVSVINGADIFVTGTQLSVSATLSPNLSTPVIFTAVNHRLDVNDEIDVESDNSSFPSSLKGKHYVVSVTANEFTIGPLGGPAHVLTTGDVSGNTTVTRHSNVPFESVKCIISANANTFFDTNQVWLKRSEKYYKIPLADIKNINTDKNYFEIDHHNSALQINGEKWTYETSDAIYVRVKGKNLGAYSDNIVSIAQDILEIYGSVVSADLDTSWTTYKNKSTPAQSAIASIKGRAWIGEPQNALEYAVSLLEQVRIELFFNRSQKIALSSLHFDDFQSSPSFIVRNWDIEKDSFIPQLDDRNNFNRVRAVFSFLPDMAENAFSTKYLKNQAAINQSGKEITKILVYPNLYIEAEVQSQATETLKLASGYREIINLTLTNRAILKDIGNWILLDVEIGSSTFSGVPCQIRDISYSPNGLKLPMRIWSFAMLPFGTWNPGYTGIVGGQSATIIAE